MAYRVGDTVVYPHHGAAVVESLEQRELKGETKDYLVLRMTYGDLTLMVPTDSCDSVGIRDVVSDAQVQEVFAILESPEGKAAKNWSRRFKANQEKLRSGDVFKVAEVVRNLASREFGKGVSAGERRMLVKAKQILLSELSVALGCDDVAAEERIDKVLADAHGVADVEAGADA